LRRAAELGVDGIDFCSIDGDHPSHDFMRYPKLLDSLDMPALASSIRNTLRDIPDLEVTGINRIIQFLDGSASQAHRGPA